MQERYRACERWVRRVKGQHQNTRRRPAKVVSIEKVKLRHRLRQIAVNHIRWGLRMGNQQLRQEGWSVNHKRVQRIWGGGGAATPAPKKRKRARLADGLVRRHRAEKPHQMWTMNIQFDATDHRRRLKILKVIDEHSRLCLAIRVGRDCNAKDEVDMLVELTSV